MTKVSIGESHPRPRSGRKTLRKCKSNVVSDKAVVIDIEGDGFPNVIDLDDPESLSKKLRASRSRKNKRCTLSDVIYIDDDDESIENNHPDVGVNKNINVSNGASSSSPDAINDGTFSGSVGDECQFVQENISPVKISKGKRTYSGKSPARNRYGLGSDSETDLSDDDFTDCELVEDPAGGLREQWEKANRKRKCENRYVHSDPFSDRSTVSPNFQQGVEVESMPAQDEEATKCFDSGKTACERDDPSPSSATIDSPENSSSSNSKCGDFLFKTQFPCTKADVEESAINLGEKEDHQYFEHGGPIPQNGLGTQWSHFQSQREETADPVGGFREQWEKANWERDHVNCYVQADYWAFNDRSTVFPDFQEGVGVESMPAQDEEATKCSGSGKTAERDDPSPSYATSINLGQKEDYQYFEHGGSISQNGLGTQWSHSKPQREETAEQVSHAGSDYEGREKTPPMEQHMSNYGCREQVSGNGEDNLEEEVRFESSKFVEEEELLQAESSYMRTGISNEQTNHNFAPSNEQVESTPENLFGKSPLNSGVCMGKIHHQENGELVNEKLRRNTCTNEAQFEHERSISQESDEELATSVLNGQQENPDDVVHANDGEIVHETETCIISDREKMKETDEYKRAIKEEMAARQQALQIQAEEVRQLRRLRKRRKAEQLRLSDMERRQKQRLEEIRESQKKDEEHMNLKESIRAEIRRQLSKLELECRDMTSLLRSLGINVGGGLRPLQHEVRAACKRALFTFHPDRASKSDIRQQVESEEKFKLISRMKEKFFLT